MKRLLQYAVVLAIVDCDSATLLSANMAALLPIVSCLLTAHTSIACCRCYLCPIPNLLCFSCDSPHAVPPSAGHLQRAHILPRHGLIRFQFLQSICLPHHGQVKFRSLWCVICLPSAWYVCLLHDIRICCAIRLTAPWYVCLLRDMSVCIL